MTKLSKEEIKQKLREMPEEWRNNWCSSNMCACSGAANCSGGLGGKCTKEEWKEALNEL